MYSTTGGSTFSSNSLHLAGEVVKVRPFLDVLKQCRE